MIAFHSPMLAHSGQMNPTLRISGLALMTERSVVMTLLDTNLCHTEQHGELISGHLEDQACRFAAFLPLIAWCYL